MSDALTDIPKNPDCFFLRPVSDQDDPTFAARDPAPSGVGLVVPVDLGPGFQRSTDTLGHGRFDDLVERRSPRPRIRGPCFAAESEYRRAPV